MILFLVVGYIYEAYGTRCSTLLHCTGLLSALLLIGLQMNSALEHYSSVVPLPLAPAAAPPEQLLGLALIPDPYSEQLPGSA